jgi:hypothetical protein
MSVKEIESLIEQLAPDEFAELMDWLRARATHSEISVDEIATLYDDSLKSGGEFTAFSNAQEDLHEYSAEELAAMKAGEFERPLR